jgi:hypothetical protein
MGAEMSALIDHDSELRAEADRVCLACVELDMCRDETLAHHLLNVEGDACHKLANMQSTTFDGLRSKAVALISLFLAEPPEDETGELAKSIAADILRLHPDREELS